MITPKGRHLGARRSRPKAGDARYVRKVGLMGAAVPPPSMDLHALLPPCFDQGPSGSCGPNSGAGLAAFLWPGFMASRLAWYYWVRVLEGDPDVDEGVETRDVLRILATIGAAPEDDWPFDLARLKQAPPETLKALAAGRRISSLPRLRGASDMIDCLAQGHPFLLGFEVPSWMDDDWIATSGILTLPPPGRGRSSLGGHDVLAVGYDLNFRSNPDFLSSGCDPALVEDEMLLIRNSWGTAWGLRSRPGHFWMPLSWAADPSTGDDAWTGHMLVQATGPTSGPFVDGVPIKGDFVA